MATLRERADKTVAKMRNTSLGAKAAAKQIVRGEGITYKPDVERIARDICSELGRRSGKAKRKRKREGVKTPSLYNKPTQLELDVD